MGDNQRLHVHNDGAAGNVHPALCAVAIVRGGARRKRGICPLSTQWNGRRRGCKQGAAAIHSREAGERVHMPPRSSLWYLDYMSPDQSEDEDVLQRLVPGCGVPDQSEDEDEVGCCRLTIIIHKVPIRTHT